MTTPAPPVRLLAASALVLLAACGTDSSGPPAPAQVQITASTTTLTALGQTADLSARVLDGRGQPISGAPVTWSTGNPAVAQVSPGGQVTAVGVGTAVITASSPPASGTVQITVQQVPTGLDAVGGVGQEGEVGLPLPQPVGFRVTDAGGSPVPGATVTVAITSGGGSVNSSSLTTGAAGTVEVVWTLGPSTAQTHRLTATAGNLSRDVTATPRAGPPETVQNVGGNNQSGPAGDPLPDSLVVRVLDRFGNPVAGAAVSWTATVGGGSLSPPQGSADAEGRARARWTLGPGVGANQARAASGEVQGPLFNANALPNAVLAGTITFSSAFLAPPPPEGWAGSASFQPATEAGKIPASGPLAEALSAWDWIPRLPAASRGAARAGVDTVPGQWVVRLRPTAVGGPGGGVAGFSAAAARAVAGAMREVLADLPALREPGAGVEGVSPVLGAARVRLPSGPAGASALEALRRDPAVEEVEPVILFHTHEVRGEGPPPVLPAGPSAPRAPDFLTQARFFPRVSWHYGLSGLPRGWEVTQGSASVVVAVVDDGIRFDHVSLAPNLTADGYDFVGLLELDLCGGGTILNSGDGDGPDPDPTVPFRRRWNATLGCVAELEATGGHGLHVAGTIAASPASGGLMGVAPGVRIRPIRVLGITGSGTNYDIAQGILYAAGLPADNGQGGVVQTSRAPIINLSLGGPGSSAVLLDAVTRAAQAGSLLVASAGNDGGSNPNFPAAYTQVMSVSAVGPEAVRASYSTWGNTIEVTAPGGDLSYGAKGGVWSAYWNFQSSSSLFASLQGTSMAAPHVSGVAALLLSAEPGLSAAQLRARLSGTAVDLGSPGRDDFYGHGLVNALLALTQGQGFPSVLRVHLVNGATGARLATQTPAADRAFRFPGLSPGSYMVYAGLDDRGDGVTGRPGFLWGAAGGASTPTAFAMAGHGTQDASFALGWPSERESNNTFNLADVLLVGGYAYGVINPVGDVDLFRVPIHAPGTYTFETGGWIGMCGWGVEVDTILDLFSPGGVLLTSHDDIDAPNDRFCSRITTFLNPGEHFVRVRGIGTGRYTIRVFQ